MTMTIPLFGRLTLLQIMEHQLTGYYVARYEPCRDVAWVSRSPRVAAFMREWFLGWDAGGLYS